MDHCSVKMEPGAMYTLISQRMPRPWIILAVSCIQFLWGCLLLIRHDVIYITPLVSMSRFPIWLSILLLMSSSVVSISSIYIQYPLLIMFSALLYQQAILSLTFIGPLLAVAAGQYGDGVSHPRLFIAADQLIPHGVLVGTHMMAIIDRWKYHRT